jgi:hypothetical protein
VPEASPVLKVVIPATVTIVIDPFEIDGRGQVFSEDYAIRNDGESDVLLTFTDMRCVFANDEDFEALARPFNEAGASDRKSIHLMLNLGREDLPPVVLTDPGRETGTEISAPLRAARNEADGAASSLTLSFSGSVNHNPAKAWRDGDIKVYLSYRLDPVLLESGEESPEAPDSEQGANPEQTPDSEQGAKPEQAPDSEQGANPEQAPDSEQGANPEQAPPQREAPAQEQESALRETAGTAPRTAQRGKRRAPASPLRARRRNRPRPPDGPKQNE